MKNNSKYSVILLLVFIAIFTGCDLNNDDEPKPEDKYLVGFEKSRDYPLSNIKSVLSLYTIIYPELHTIADNLQFDIKVYTITYKTKFDGKDIIASGLVSIPDNAGATPVISYQNGTNTLHSDAP